jgi:Flp pilus assembly protein TadG
MAPISNAEDGGLFGDRRGAAAVEFAFLAPVLMLMMLGTVELGRAIAIDRSFESAVATASDLVSREESLGTSKSDAAANLSGMMGSVKQLMSPYDAAPFRASIFSVKASANDATKGTVQWVYPYNSPENPPAQCSSYALPANLVPKGGSVIVVDGQYTFKSLFGDYVPGISSTMKWSEKSLHSPRNSCVDYVLGDNCINKC